MRDLITALRGARNNPPQPDDYLDQILTEAADKLEAIIEECAKVIEGYEGWTGDDEWVAHMAAAIRRLKDQP